MSRDALNNKIYEERVVNDSLARLAKRLDVKSLPFSDEEMKTLAKRFRQSFGSEKKKERLERYRAHLAKIHGAEAVAAVSSVLVEINNEISWEEK
jgi:hypothetical protein